LSLKLATVANLHAISSVANLYYVITLHAIYIYNIRTSQQHKTQLLQGINHGLATQRHCDHPTSEWIELETSIAGTGKKYNTICEVRRSRRRINNRPSPSPLWIFRSMAHAPLKACQLLEFAPALLGGDLTCWRLL